MNLWLLIDPYREKPFLWPQKPEQQFDSGRVESTKFAFDRRSTKSILDEFEKANRRFSKNFGPTQIERVISILHCHDSRYVLSNRVERYELVVIRCLNCQYINTTSYIIVFFPQYTVSLQISRACTLWYDDCTEYYFNRVTILIRSVFVWYEWTCSLNSLSMKENRWTNSGSSFEKVSMIFRTLVVSWSENACVIFHFYLVLRRVELKFVFRFQWETWRVAASENEPNDR